MAKICFPCALSVFWVRSNYFVISLSPSQGGFPTCPFITLVFKIFEDFFFYYPFFSSQGKGLHCEFQYPAVQYSHTWGNSVHWAIVECLCNSVFRCCCLLDSREICVFIIYIYVSIYVCVSLFFMFKAISKPKTRLGFLCEASYRVRRWSWSLAKTHLKAVGFFLGTVLRLMKCWDRYRFSLSCFLLGDLFIHQTKDWCFAENHV